MQGCVTQEAEGLVSEPNLQDLLDELVRVRVELVEQRAAIERVLARLEEMKAAPASAPPEVLAGLLAGRRAAQRAAEPPPEPPAPPEPDPEPTECPTCNGGLIRDDGPYCIKCRGHVAYDRPTDSFRLVGG